MTLLTPTQVPSVQKLKLLSRKAPLELISLDSGSFVPWSLSRDFLRNCVAIGSRFIPHGEVWRKIYGKTTDQVSLTS